MHFYRLCLIFLHTSSALCYFPHLITHITYRSFRSISYPAKIAYITYWFNYCLLVMGVLCWCLFVICRKQTTWQVIQVSGFVLIAKLIYIIFDVITRILLEHKLIVIVFDFVHMIILFPAIIITFLLVKRVKRIMSISNKCQSFLDQL
jgi:hypothetical protein